MLREDQLDVIREFVSETYFDQEKLIKYLSIHDVVGIEVFDYVAKEVYPSYPGSKTALSVAFLDGNCATCFEPMPVDVFVRRIPFNFYIEGEPTFIDAEGKEQEHWHTIEITNLTYCIGKEAGAAYHNHRETPLTLEDAYQKLEFLYYEHGFSLKEIFSYTEGEQWCCFDETYADWFNYLDMCMELGWDDYMPDAFYYKYNLAREALGKEPIMFYIQDIDSEAWREKGPDAVEYYVRKGDKMSLLGMFPVDEDGIPVMRWIGVDIKDAASITSDFREKGDYQFHIIVTLSPRTVVRALIPAERDDVGNMLPEAGRVWKQLYAGPQTMTFNYPVMKKRRKELGYTQQQVAEAVQTNVRTYQKWESGETTPDGYYLLRLLNWLDIPGVSDVIIYSGLA